MEKRLTIKVFEEILSVCRLDKSARVPDWAEGDFLTITRTPEELSIVCCQKTSLKMLSANEVGDISKLMKY